MNQTDVTDLVREVLKPVPQRDERVPASDERNFRVNLLKPPEQLSRWNNALRELCEKKYHDPEISGKPLMHAFQDLLCRYLFQTSRENMSRRDGLWFVRTGHGCEKSNT